MFFFVLFAVTAFALGAFTGTRFIKPVGIAAGLLLIVTLPAWLTIALLLAIVGGFLYLAKQGR